MTMNERLLKLATANAATLSRIDAILEGREPVRKPDAPQAEINTGLITKAEAAKRLHVSWQTVYRLCRDGSLDQVNVRGKNRVRLESVIAYASGEKAA